MVVEPLEWWAVKFFGSFNLPSNKKTYILVSTNYVTKWVETMALLRATEESVINFIFDLFVRYGLPSEVITNGGEQFVGNKITTTLKNHHVTHRVTSPYHPQANGRVESTNKFLESILTKIVSTHHRDWATTLS